MRISQRSSIKMKEITPQAKGKRATIKENHSLIYKGLVPHALINYSKRRLKKQRPLRLLSIIPSAIKSN
jgi:hypothetical protein